MSDAATTTAQDTTEAAKGATDLATTDSIVTAPAKPEGEKLENVETNTDASTDAKAEKDAETKTKGDDKSVPEKYDLKLPKDSPLDPARLEKFSAFAKARGLSQDQAQEILTREHEAVASFVEMQKTQAAQNAKAWEAATKADRELGGEAFEKTKTFAGRAVEKFGNDAFRKALNETGLGNHPEVVRVFARVGKAMANDELIPSGNQVQGGKKAPEDVLYKSGN